MVELGKGKPNLRELQETVNVAIAFSWSNDSSQRVSQAPLWLQTSIHCFIWKKGETRHSLTLPSGPRVTYEHTHMNTWTFLACIIDITHTHTYTVLILALLNCVWLQPSEKSLWPISQLKYAQPRSNLENKLIIELHDSLCKTPIDRSLTVERLAFLRSQYQPLVNFASIIKVLSDNCFPSSLVADGNHISCGKWEGASWATRRKFDN